MNCFVIIKSGAYPIKHFGVNLLTTFNKLYSFKIAYCYISGPKCDSLQNRLNVFTSDFVYKISQRYVSFDHLNIDSKY